MNSWPASFSSTLSDVPRFPVPANSDYWEIPSRKNWSGYLSTFLQGIESGVPSRVNYVTVQVLQWASHAGNVGSVRGLLASPCEHSFYTTEGINYATTANTSLQSFVMQASSSTAGIVAGYDLLTASFWALILNHNDDEMNFRGNFTRCYRPSIFWRLK